MKNRIDQDLKKLRNKISEARRSGDWDLLQEYKSEASALRRLKARLIFRGA